jgi:hypothetical protein
MFILMIPVVAAPHILTAQQRRAEANALVPIFWPMRRIADELDDAEGRTDW